MSLRPLFLFVLLSFYHCAFSQSIQSTTTKKQPENKTAPVQDDYIKILWLDKNRVLQLNEDYIKTLTNPQRAALGFIATSVGNECHWDGDKKVDESNLKCKFLSALNLGYQCSDTHLSFLKQWFKEDSEVLESLQFCTKTESSATNQDFFLWLKMSTTHNQIRIIYSAVGIDTETGSKWKWTEESTYSYTQNGIKRIHKKNLQGGFL